MSSDDETETMLSTEIVGLDGSAQLLASDDGSVFVGFGRTSLVKGPVNQITICSRRQKKQHTFLIKYGVTDIVHVQKSNETIWIVMRGLGFDSKSMNAIFVIGYPVNGISNPSRSTSVFPNIGMALHSATLEQTGFAFFDMNDIPSAPLIVFTPRRVGYVEGSQIVCTSIDNGLICHSENSRTGLQFDFARLRVDVVNIAEQQQKAYQSITVLEFMKEIVEKQKRTPRMIECMSRVSDSCFTKINVSIQW